MDPLTLAGGSAAIGGAIELTKEVVTKIRSVKSGVDTANKYLKNNSLVDIAKVAQVQPILLVDADCMNVSYLSDVTQAMHTLFAGYYLQAVNLMGTIGGISLARKLEPLSPGKRSFEEHRDWRYSQESYRHRLPTTHNKLAMEDEQSRAMEIDKDGVKTIQENTSLSTGKLYNVKITEDGVSAVIPVAIRVLVNMVPTRSLVNMFTFKQGHDTDLVERFHSWRAGALNFSDMFLCRDLIEKHRTELIKDKAGVYSAIIDRQNNHKAAGMMKGSPSLATASNLAIISKDTAAAIEQKLNGKLSSVKIRSVLFDNTNLMILAVIEKDWDRVVFYTRGIAETTSVSDKELKKAAGSGGSADVMDIMKAFIAGSAPRGI